jgi:hypothetical protein
METELKTNNCFVDEVCKECSIQFEPDILILEKNGGYLCSDCALKEPVKISQETFKIIVGSY